ISPVSNKSSDREPCLQSLVRSCLPSRGGGSAVGPRATHRTGLDKSWRGRCFNQSRRRCQGRHQGHVRYALQRDGDVRRGGGPRVLPPLVTARSYRSGLLRISSLRAAPFAFRVKGEPAKTKSGILTWHAYPRGRRARSETWT